MIKRPHIRPEHSPARILERLAETQELRSFREPLPPALDMTQQPKRAQGFFKVAAHRKRQILERMLSDWQ